MVAAVMVAIVGIVACVTLNRMVTADTIAVDNLNVFRATPGDKTGISEMRNSLGSEYIVDLELKFGSGETHLVCGDDEVPNHSKRVFSGNSSPI